MARAKKNSTALTKILQETAPTRRPPSFLNPVTVIGGPVSKRIGWVQLAKLGPRFILARFLLSGSMMVGGAQLSLLLHYAEHHAWAHAGSCFAASFFLIVTLSIVPVLLSDAYFMLYASQRYEALLESNASSAEQNLVAQYLSGKLEACKHQALAPIVDASTRLRQEIAQGKALAEEATRAAEHDIKDPSRRQRRLDLAKRPLERAKALQGQLDGLDELRQKIERAFERLKEGAQIEIVESFDEQAFTARLVAYDAAAEGAFAQAQTARDETLERLTSGLAELQETVIPALHQVAAHVLSKGEGDLAVELRTLEDLFERAEHTFCPGRILAEAKIG